jgi:hypothetical protein
MPRKRGCGKKLCETKQQTLIAKKSKVFGSINRKAADSGCCETPYFFLDFFTSFRMRHVEIKFNREKDDLDKKKR